jgi:rhodanese-related sulfurtransferase
MAIHVPGAGWRHINPAKLLCQCSRLAYPSPVKANHPLLAVCALFLPLAGCKSDSQEAMDADVNEVLPMRETGQLDAASVGTSGDATSSPADRPSQPELDVLDAATDVRSEATDLPAVDKPGADESAIEPGSDAGCSGWTTLLRLSPAEVASLIATSNPIVINVHTPYAGDIPGTDTSIPYSNVDAIEAYLNHDHCADVLLVCLSGGMSQSAGNELIKRGYLRVRDLNGGMQAWQSAGYPLVKDGGS